MITGIAQHTEKLYYFHEIAICGGFQSASRKIGLSAASLSYSIKQLEAAAGTPLFVRSKTGVQLTPAGEALLTFCRKLYRDLEDISRHMLNSSSKLSQRVRVGTFQSIAIYFWPLLHEALNNTPNLSISITTNRSSNIIESLLKRDIDLALTVEGINHKNLIKHELYSDQYSFYTSPTIKKKALTAKDLSEMPILFIPDAIDEKGLTIRQYIDSWNFKFKDEFELDSLEVISKFVNKGYGIGILPTRAAKASPHSLSKKSIKDLAESNFGNHRFFLSYRDDLNISQKLINLIVKASTNAVASMNSQYKS